MENEVRDNKQEGRFELALEGGQTAYVEYEEAGEGVLALTHTLIDFGGVPLDPAKHGRVIHVEAALAHHLRDIAI